MIGEPKKKLRLNKPLTPEQVTAIDKITGQNGCYNIAPDQSEPTLKYRVEFHDAIIKKLGEWGIASVSVAAS